MHCVVLGATKHAIQIVGFISLNCDDIRTMDNQSWMLGHSYVVQNWCMVHVLLNLL
jgi:hypothetical protein